MAARVRLTPLRLIEVRDGLAARARARLEDERGDYMPFFRMVWERAWGAAGALSVAPAWWVSADMADLAVAAAADGVPEDALPQTMDGFLAFGRDLPADATPDFPWPVRAVHWSAREVGGAGGHLCRKCFPGIASSSRNSGHIA